MGSTAVEGCFEARVAGGDQVLHFERVGIFHRGRGIRLAVVADPGLQRGEVGEARLSLTHVAVGSDAVADGQTIIVAAIQQDFIASRPATAVGAEQGVELRVEAVLAGVDDDLGIVAGLLKEGLGESIDIAAGPHGRVILVVDVPGAFEEHATGSHRGGDIAVQVVVAIIGPDVGQGKVEVFHAFLHDGRARVTVLVLLVKLVVGEHVVVVRDIAERLDDRAVLIGTEETGDAHPVIVFFLRVVILEFVQTRHERIPFADPGEIPARAAAAHQQADAFGTVPVVVGVGQQDVVLGAARRDIVAALIPRKAGRRLGGRPT